MPSSIERRTTELFKSYPLLHLSFSPIPAETFKDLKRSDVVKMITAVLGKTGTIGSIEDAGRLKKNYNNDQWQKVFDLVENKKQRPMPAVLFEDYVPFDNYVDALGTFYGPFKPE